MRKKNVLPRLTAFAMSCALVLSSGVPTYAGELDDITDVVVDATPDAGAVETPDDVTNNDMPAETETETPQEPGETEETGETSE